MRLLFGIHMIAAGAGRAVYFCFFLQAGLSRADIMSVDKSRRDKDKAPPKSLSVKGELFLGCRAVWVWGMGCRGERVWAWGV